MCEIWLQELGLKEIEDFSMKFDVYFFSLIQSGCVKVQKSHLFVLLTFPLAY